MAQIVLFGLAWIVIALASHPAAGATRAFPGAEGFGARSAGGRGGVAVRVNDCTDDLDWSGTDAEVTLREALEKDLEPNASLPDPPRVVVFDCGGIIALLNHVKIEFPFVTIAGQTAPGDGIGIVRSSDQSHSCTGTALVVDTHDVVLRHLRIRPGVLGTGATGCTPQDEESVGLKIDDGAYNVIVDHCSLSWNEDGINIGGGIGSAGAEDVTFQWSIISEGINHATVAGDPGQGMTFHGASSDVTLHHNLFAHNKIRNPSISSEGVFDLVNNVIYDAPGHASEINDFGDLPIELNYVGNQLIQPSPVPSWHELRLYKQNDDGPPPEPFVLVAPGFEIFLDGNIGPNRTSDAEPEDEIIHCTFQYQQDPKQNYLCEDELSPEPIDPDDFLVTTAHAVDDAVNDPRLPAVSGSDSVWNDIKATVGATAQIATLGVVRDGVDECIVLHVDEQEGGTISNPADGCGSGGWSLASTDVAPVDADGDGMPAGFESGHDLDDEDAGDAAEDADGDCWTNLEEFLNETDPEAVDGGSVAISETGVATEDGTTQEGSIAGQGGSSSATQQQVFVGDEPANKELRAVLSFDTSDVPGDALICRVELTLTALSAIGSPAGLGPIYVVAPAPVSGGFGGATSLHKSDFQAAATAADADVALALVSGAVWGATLPDALVAAEGTTQLRLQIAADDGDGVSDFHRFDSADFTGDSSAKPKLRVVYQP